MIADCRLPIADLCVARESQTALWQVPKAFGFQIGKWQSAIGNKLAKP